MFLPGCDQAGESQGRPEDFGGCHGYPRCGIAETLCLEGDWYAMQEELDVVRGVTMPPGSGTASVPGIYGSKCFDESVVTSNDHLHRELEACLTEEVYFEDFFAAPAAPSDQWFGIAITSVELPGISPVEAGNRCLRMLRGSASVSKVNPVKFTIRAKACIDHIGSCELKVFVFAMCPPQMGSVIEFQRRRGDTVAFNKVFQNLRVHLGSDTQFFNERPVVCDTQVAACNTRTLPNDLNDGVETLAPLLEMARYSEEDSEMQAEAASSLQSAIEDNLSATEAIQRLAQHLSTQQAHWALEKLLSADCFRVVYPISRLLSALSACPDGMQCFWDREYPQLIRLVLAKLQDRATSRMVKEELALSLCCFVQHSVMDVGTVALARALEQLIKRPPVAGAAEVLNPSHFDTALESLVSFLSGSDAVSSPCNLSASCFVQRTTADVH